MTFSAVDGSYYSVITLEGKECYVVVGLVRGKVDNSRFEISSVDYVEVMEPCEDEEESMAQLEYSVAYSEKADLILMDRMFTYDQGRGLSPPPNSLGIVKDFRGSGENYRRELTALGGTPWITQEFQVRGVNRGFFRLCEVCLPFMYERVKDLSPGETLKLLTIMGMEPVQEALGYNYPLFLADKVAKHFRWRGKRLLDFISAQRRSYREFRNSVEELRRVRSGRG